MLLASLMRKTGVIPANHKEGFMLKAKSLLVFLTIVSLMGCAKRVPVVPAPKETPFPSGPITVASSGLVEKMNLEGLATSADTILVGTVTAVTSRWNDENTTILTEVRITVGQAVAGVIAANEVTLVLPGGKVGVVEQGTSGIPRFVVGERVLVFLKQGEGGRFQVVGGFQGKLTIEYNVVLELNVSLPVAIEQINAIRQGLPSGATEDNAEDRLPEQTRTAP